MVDRRRNYRLGFLGFVRFVRFVVEMFEALMQGGALGF